MKISDLQIGDKVQTGKARQYFIIFIMLKTILRNEFQNTTKLCILSIFFQFLIPFSKYLPKICIIVCSLISI